MPIEKITKDTEAGQSAEWFEKQYQHAYIDLNKPPPPEDGLIAIGTYNDMGQIKSNYIMSKGELSAITAPSKTYKSTIKSHFASVFFNGIDNNFTEFKGKRKKIESLIDVDTEQGKRNAWKTFHRTKRLANYTDLQKYYYPFKLRHLSALERVNFIDMLLKSGKINKPALMFIDGIADLIDDSNDLALSNDIVNKVMHWTDILNIHVCAVIHNAYNTLKPTGHLGSAVVKKAQTVINLSKVEEENDNEPTYKAIHQYSRGASFKEFYFKYNPTKGCLYEVDDLGNETDENIF